MPGQRGFPLEREISVAEPLAALASLARLPGPFLLHSSLADERGRWSFFGADPFALFRAERYERAVASFRAFAQRARTEERPATAAPFTGGVVGYWAYDFGRRLEKIPSVAADDLGLPDFVLGFYDVVGAIDHAAGRAFLYSSGLPLAGEIAYAAGKGALEWLAVSAAAELAPRGITVNAIDPGPTETGWISAELRERLLREAPLGRLGRPVDSASLVAFLCSDRGGFVTGQVLRCDGGWSTLRAVRHGRDPE